MLWHACELSLAEVAARLGSIVFAAEVGPTDKAYADWLAIARARICRRNGPEELVLYDFRKHLNFASIEPVKGMQYQTDNNVPMIPMAVWLKQEPALILRNRYEYQPALPLRLLDRECHAGFWSSGWGLLQFSVSAKRSLLETICVFEVAREVDKYEEFTPSWY